MRLGIGTESLVGTNGSTSKDEPVEKSPAETGPVGVDREVWIR